MTQGSISSRTRKGFTLVELLLSMAFISVLLLAVAMTIMQISATYNRGMTLKEVNQSGRLISEDMRYNVSTSSAFTADGSSFAEDSSSSPRFGRLCLGNYSYLWNYGRGLVQGVEPSKMTVDGNALPVRFVKVVDPSRKYCQKDSNGLIAIKDVESSDVSSARELLGAGDKTLAIQGFSVESPEDSVDSLTGHRLHRISFTIGSGDISAMDSEQTRCLMPGESLDADMAYCVVQKFTLVIRAGSGVN